MTKAYKQKNKIQLIAKRIELRAIRRCSLQAFTLLELLLVIAIVAVLAGIIMFSLKPADRIQKANNIKRKADVDAIKKAINAYGLDNGGAEFDLTICTNTICEICSTTDVGVCTTAGKLNIGGLIGTQLSSIPSDPRSSNWGENGTGYYISKTSTYTKVIALGAELGEVITSEGVTRAGTIAGATFTPNIAKRNSAGPFAAGVLVQGNYDNSGVGDVLTYNIGSSLNGQFYPYFDKQQGTIVFWVTPEWSGTGGTGRFTLIDNQGWAVEVLQNNAWLRFVTSGAYMDYDISSWIAGNTYQVVIRWDRNNPIDGSSYGSITVNDVSSYGMTTPPGVTAVNTLFVGNSYWNSGAFSSNSIIEGLTIYRRPLFDGTYGIDVGNGDEITQIYNGGTGQDPTLITGSWDVVFSLPTNTSVGTIATGTGNAWSHPHTSNLLYTSTTNTGGLMMGADATTDGWTNVGSPTSIAALSTSEKIYAGGYKYVSNAVNQGVYRTFTATAGGDYVLRALGHSDGTCNPKIQITRADGTTVITSLTGTTTSTRTAPNVYIFTWESPAAESEQVQLINTASSGTCYWHQVEVLNNLINNPSFEAGSGDPWIPTGWSNVSLVAGESSQDLSNIHSGASAVTINSVSSLHYIRQAILSTTGKFYSAGVWAKKVSGNSAGAFDVNRLGPNLQSTANGGNNTVALIQSSSTSIVFVPAVIRQHSSSYSHLGFGTYFWGSAIWDDAYSFLLSDISLTVTPSNLANSTEASGLRIDGKDIYTKPIEKVIDVKGSIEFDVTPRYSFSVADKFGFTRPVIAHLYINAQNSLKLYKQSATILRLTGIWNGVTVNGDWTNPTLNAGTKYNMEITYESSTSMKLIVDGVDRISVALSGKKFGVTPSGTLYIGSDNAASNQYDLTVDTNTITFRLI